MENTCHMQKPRYDIYVEDTVRAEYAVSNHDNAPGIQIACLLKNKKDITIDGNGALLMFHDRITPFLLDGCENICIRNLTIDYERPFFTQGRILEASRNTVKLKIENGYPYRVKDGDLIMIGEKWENNLRNGMTLIQEFDPVVGGPAYQSPVLSCRIGEGALPDPKSPLPMHIFTAEECGDYVITLHGDFPYPYTVGNELIMTHEPRFNSGIVINGCKGITLENIHIIHTGAMGIAAQMSENITLKQVKVTTGQHSDRMVSTNCDAAHFISCSGKISITDCTLDSMMDDGINVHGVYTGVIEISDSHTLTVQVMHFQQEGVLFYRAGDQIVVYCGHTAVKRAGLTVEAAEMAEEGRIRICFKEPVQDVRIGDFIENLTTVPELYVRGLHTGKNRPRGVLATTPGKVVIEDSVFYNSGYGVHIAGDTGFWYESGAVRDVLIRRNKFIGCGYNIGDYSIAITPEFEGTDRQRWFHSGIRIEENYFEAFTDGIIYAAGVKGLKISDNLYKQTGQYKKRKDTKRVTLKECFEVQCDMETEEESLTAQY